MKTPGPVRVLEQHSFWWSVSYPESSSFISRSRYGCFWNSLGPDLLDIWGERVCVTYWKKANDLRSSLGQTESFQWAMCTHTQAACAVLAFAKTDKASHESNISGHLKAVMTKKLRLPESPQIFYFIRKTSKTILTNYSWIFTKTVSPLLFCSHKTKFLCTLAQEIFCFPWLKLSLGKWPCYLLKIIPAGPAS